MKISFYATAMLLFVCIGLTKVSFAEGFSLPGSDGKTHSLDDYNDAKAVVVLFISTRCPVSNGFNERMAELAAMYQSKDIVFLGINSNMLENMDEIKKHANDNKFPFVVLKDDKNLIADVYKAKVTPEVFIHSGGAVVYHGRIDDSPKASERKSEDLKTALDEIVAGKNVSASETKAFGCSIKRI